MNEMLLNKKTLFLSHKVARVGSLLATSWMIAVVGSVLFPDAAHAYSTPATCVDNTYGDASSTGTVAFDDIFCSVRNLVVGNVGGSVALGLLGFGVYQAGFGKGGLAGAIPPFITGMLLGMGPTMAGWLGFVLA